MKISVLFSLFFLGLFFTGPLPLQAQETARPSVKVMKAKTSAMVKELKRADLWIGGAVVVTNGKHTNTSVYGTADSNGTRKISKNTHFEIGSVSKSFAGIILAWVIKTHPKVNLDDTLDKFVPKLAGHFSGHITLRQLATHTSGLPPVFCFGKSDLTPGYCFRPSNPEDPYADLQESQLLNFLLLFNRDGQEPYPYQYSNSAFATLGYVLTQITHQSFSEMLHEAVTGPLGMTHTWVNAPDYEISDFPNGHDVMLRTAHLWHFNDLTAPAGGIVSTAHDMAIYLRANLNPPKSILGEAILYSQTNRLGWDNNINDKTLWKNGGTAGFSTMMNFNPSAQVATLVMSNVGTVFSAELVGSPIFLAPIFGGKLRPYRKTSLIYTLVPTPTQRYFPILL